VLFASFVVHLSGQQFSVRRTTPPNFQFHHEGREEHEGKSRESENKTFDAALQFGLLKWMSNPILYPDGMEAIRSTV